MAEELYYDVTVVGAGNAALCAALAARDQGAAVAVLEKAPPSAQGGNCPYTGAGFRFTHTGLDDLKRLVPDLAGKDLSHTSMAPYSAEEFRRHLTTVTHGDTSEELMEALIAESRPTVDWMHAKGVRWELPVQGSVARAPSTIPNQVGLAAYGAGPGLVDMLTKAARRNGIQVLYETKMLKLLQGPKGEVNGLMAQDADGVHTIRAKAVVLACGGFEANAEMRTKYLGGHWERAKVRGARYNTGDGHRAAMEIGAAAAGQWTGCHGTPIDINAPATGIVKITDSQPRRSYPIGIMANVAGRRFMDEGEGFAEQTFVKAAVAVLKQERGIAYQVFDAKARPHLEERYGIAKPVEAATIRDLATKLGVNAAALEATVSSFNAAARDGDYAPRTLDGKAAHGLDIPKSNWAIKLDRPPFVAYTVTGGITYTYGGLCINAKAQVLDTEDKPIRGLFAAGEIIGGIFYHNSLRSGGLMHGAVFGRLGGIGAGRMREE
ncbi:MAG: FAD-dependent oxidoreductase [SAR202 cluster bacterium]|nr:FAD-dependent oxidoreductase [SAR202 cluster bacterium]